jgi:Carboxypeptidase regulatory-like domain
MRRPLALAVLAVVLVMPACARSSASSGSASLTGTVVAGPTCPVEQAGSPCPPQLWTGTVQATAADGHAYETATANDGSFSLALPPGSYTVVAVTGAGLPRGVPQTVTVNTGTPRTITLEVDTGIR